MTVGTDNAPVAAPEFARTPTALRSIYREPGYGTISAIENLVELGMTAEEALVAGSPRKASMISALSRSGSSPTCSFWMPIQPQTSRT